MCIFNVSALQQLLRLKTYLSYRERLCQAVAGATGGAKAMFLNVFMLLSRPGLLTLQLILGCKANVVYNHIFMYLNVLKVCVCVATWWPIVGQITVLPRRQVAVKMAGLLVFFLETKKKR